MTEAPTHLDSVSTETELGRRPGRPNDKMKARILSLYDEHWSRATRERFWHAHKALVMLEDLGWLTGDQERAVRLSSFRDGERGTLNVSKLQRLAMAELLKYAVAAGDEGGVEERAHDVLVALGHDFHYARVWAIQKSLEDQPHGANK